MRIAIATAALLSTALTGTLAEAASLEDVFGLWLTENQKAIVEVAPCGQMACGRIVWLAEPNRPDGSAKVDQNNPDPALQSRPVCGLPLIGNFQRGGDSWDDGFIYNPEDGETYTSTMHVTTDGNLYVRGYVGLPLFGKSQTWTRAADTRGGC